MKETSDLSLTSSIDYFSDEDVDICKPPVFERHDDLGIFTEDTEDRQVEMGSNAEFVRVISKPDIDFEQVSIEPVLQDTRDTVEAVKEDTQPTGSRECLKEDSFGVGPKMDDCSLEAEENAIVNTTESLDTQPETIKPSSSNVTVIPYPTLEMVEVFDKLKDEPRDSATFHDVATPRETEDATVNSNMNSLKKVKSHDSLGTPKTSVSFAEDVSQDGGLTKNASGLSKKSLYSRVSRISAKKSKSKDSVKSSKQPAGEAPVAASLKSMKSTSSLKSDSVSNIPIEAKSETGDAEDAIVNSNMNSLKKVKSHDSLGTPKPSVSFDGGLTKSASGLSKKSLYSRVSRTSTKKSKSKDSVESSKKPAGEAPVAASLKSMKSTSSLKSDSVSNIPIEAKSETGDASGIDIESKPTELQSEDKVSLVTIDNPDKPITKSESLQPSIKTKASKDSICSKMSENKVKDFVPKTSSSKDDKFRTVTSPVTTPKVVGPPRRLPRWGGIPKPELSISNANCSGNIPSDTVPDTDVGNEISKTNEVEAHPSDSAVPTESSIRGEEEIAAHPSDSAVPTESRIHGEEEIAGDKLGVKRDVDFVSESAHVSPRAAPDITASPGHNLVHSQEQNGFNADENVDEEPCIDATSTLTSSSGKGSSRSKTSDAKSSSTQVTSKAKSEENDSKNLSNDAENAKEVLVDDSLDSKKNADSKQLTVDVHVIENSPIQEVMKPFSPISVPVCATEEDPIMKNLSEVCLSDEALETAHDVKSNELTPKNLLVNEVKSKNLTRKKLWSSIFAIFGRPSRGKSIKDEKRSVLKLESLDTEIGANGCKNASDQGNLHFSRKEVGCVVESLTRDEVEVVKPATPKSTRTKSLGILGSSLHKNQHVKGDRLNAVTKIESKMIEPQTYKESELNQEQQIAIPIVAEESQPQTEITLVNQEITNTTHGDNLHQNRGLKELDPIEALTNTTHGDNLHQNRGLKELDPIEAPELRAKNRANSGIQKAWNTTGIFQKSRLSNEQKRQVAIKTLGKSPKVPLSRKERSVKLSALIDEQVVVESLHVADSESLKNSLPQSDWKDVAKTIVPSKTSIPSTKNCEKNEDNFAPIILVDCRSSKGIETIGKAHTPTSRSLKGKMGFLLSPFSRSKKIAEQKQVAEPVEETEVDCGYTSGDTVTDANEVELKKVAHLEVPFASNNVDSMPRTGHVGELPSGFSSKCNSDPKPSLQRSNSPSWIAPLIELFSPKVTTNSAHGKSSAIETEPKDSHYDEVMAEFNECHNFYIHSCTELHGSMFVEEGTNDAVVAEDVDGTRQSPSAQGNSWTDHFMEWISPKSKLGVMNLNEAPSEKNQELIQKVVVVAEDRSEMHENAAHEGTEITLDCSEPTAATETEVLQEKAPAKGGRFSNSFILRGKKSIKNDDSVNKIQPKVTAKLFDAPEVLASGQPPQPAPSQGFSKIFAKKPRKVVEPVEYARSVVAEHKKYDEKKSEKAPTEIAPVAEPAPPDERPSLSQKGRVFRATEKIETPIALFTFTSDEYPTDPTNSGQKTSLAETKNTSQKGCCEERNVMEGVVGFDDDTSRDNLQNFIAGNPPVELDDDVESSVGYLNLVKNKRQARRNRGESGADSSRSSGVNEKEISNTEGIGQTATTSDKKVGNVENLIISSEMDVHRRVSAVSDELGDEMKTNLSSASSSLPSSLYESKDGPGKSSFLSSIEGKESKDTSIREQAVTQTLPRNHVAANSKPPKPSTKANRRPIQQKDEDSIGVTVNSQLNTFDDDLSGVFAPVTKIGKWLW
jgi:hypothetical protein